MSKLSNQKLGLNITLEEVDESVRGEVVENHSQDHKELRVKYPIKFSSKNVNGTIDFGISLRFVNSYSLQENKNKWFLKIHKQEMAEISNYKCDSNSKWCDEVYQYMQSDFSILVLSWENEHPYDQPQSFRMMNGLLNYINDFTARPIETLHIEVANSNLNIFFNCKQLSIQDVLEKPVAPHDTEISFSQNLFDNFGFPHEVDFSIKDMKDDLPDYLNQDGIGIFKFTKDPISLAKIDHTKLQQPFIGNQTSFKRATRSPHPYLDKISIHQNIFFEVRDQNSDLTIVPVSINWDFLALGRMGPKYMYGQVQEFKFEHLGIEVDIHECQHIQREYSMDYGAIEQEEDDDDFEDDDDEKNVTQQMGHKTSIIAGLVCPMREQLVKDHLPKFQKYLEKLVKHPQFDQYLAQINDYYPMTNKKHSSYALCTGIDTREPQFRFEKNRMVWSFELNKSMYRTGDYCETRDYMAQIDPRHFIEKDPIRQQKIDTGIQRNENFKTYIQNQDFLYLFTRVDFEVQGHFWMGYEMLPMTLYYFTTFTYMKDYCRSIYPDPPQGSSVLFYDNCALALVNNKGIIGPIPHSMYFNFEDQANSKLIKLYHDHICDIILAAAIIFKLTNIKFNSRNLLIFIFIANQALGFVDIFDISMRYGVDYNAYIQQAGLVYNGETDYTKLSSHLGPCYYPAGHIWHYVLAYWLHMQTEYAEYIIRFGHQIIHSLTIIFVTKIAYVYFDKKSSQAQLIAFILLCNKNERLNYLNMFNDELMMLYIVICMYFAITGKSIKAPFMLTIALGQKAGVLLLLPAFLGQVQYNHGTIELFRSLFIIVALQILIALPFVLGETSVADYLHRSKLTGAGRDGIAGAEPYWDYLAAEQSHSIFWTFIPREWYYTKNMMSDSVKITMLALNVWHFFIRKWCLPQCFSNLFNTFSSKQALGIKTREQVQLTTEIIIIGYMSGIAFMPGGNIQFQFWFSSLFPLFIEMVGVPQIFTFWIYNNRWPIVNHYPYEDPKYQHLIIIGLVLWLNTVGPRFELIKKWF